MARGPAGDADGAVTTCDELPAMERVLGKDYSRALTDRRNPACWRGEAGDAAGAAAAFDELLSDRRRVPAPDPPTPWEPLRAGPTNGAKQQEVVNWAPDNGGWARECSKRTSAPSWRPPTINCGAPPLQFVPYAGSSGTTSRRLVSALNAMAWT
ncbi:hypothetical protein GCM10010276_87030 [Streptomyces longisporus]|uniref:Uncharacterized protein n=1 Tax=Streptomyces longisporus TaxID=1948 RepID=A0ABN3NHV4_STRLO